LVAVRRELVVACPFLACPVEVGVSRNPAPLCCGDKGLDHARQLAATAPLSEYVAEEILPDPKRAGEADLLAFARKHGATIFHPVGTCRMGSDSDAVVDPRLRVRGVEALWIADCSIMPRLISGNTNVPAMMIGEKAADMICADSPK
jgi:choline dehydrogenase